MISNDADLIDGLKAKASAAIDEPSADPILQEISATLRALNDAWTQGDPDLPNTLRRFFHRDMVAITAMDRHRREGVEACVEGWCGFANTARIHSWQEINPLIRRYGDAAVVTYDYEIRFDMNGKRHEESGRDMFFFVRENGRWCVVADQFSSRPS